MMTLLKVQTKPDRCGFMYLLVEIVTHCITNSQDNLISSVFVLTVMPNKYIKNDKIFFLKLEETFITHCSVVKTEIFVLVFVFQDFQNKFLVSRSC